jgi:hypothetical protein
VEKIHALCFFFIFACAHLLRHEGKEIFTQRVIKRATGGLYREQRESVAKKGSHNEEPIDDGESVAIFERNSTKELFIREKLAVQLLISFFTFPFTFFHSNYY